MEKLDFILNNAKRVNNFDLLTQAQDFEMQDKIIWGEIKTVYEKVFWKTNSAEYEEAIVEVVTDNGLIVYVSQRNLSYHMPDPDSLVFLIGKKVPLVVNFHVRIDGTQQNWDEVYYRPNSDYVLLGSIKQAEWILGKDLQVRYRSENSPLRKELRGIVTDIFEPTSSRGNRFISIEFEGATVTIPAKAFSYISLSRVQKLDDIVRAGQEVYFKIFDIEERPVTISMRERHIKMGETDTFWDIVGEALYNKEEPHDAIKRLKESGASSTQAYLLSESVNGYMVELVDAPGISLRMRPGGKGKYRPTHQMVTQHERVAVGLSSLQATYETTSENYDKYNGFVTYIPKR